MKSRLKPMYWIAVPALAAGIVATVVGVLRLPRVGEGGYGTIAVGAPAYAAIFTSALHAKWWFVSGTLVAAAGGLALLAVMLSPGPNGARHARTRWLGTWVASAVLPVGVVLLAIGVVRLNHEFTLRTPDDREVNLTKYAHLHGQHWLEVGTALLAIGWVAAVVKLARRGRTQAQGAVTRGDAEP